MKIEFRKMEGAGNDFIVIDNRGGVVKDGALAAQKLCDRHFGIGADGLLLLENSSEADFRMTYYNADGSHGGMCGNGGRCIALYASDLGIGAQTMRFEALDFIYSAELSGKSVSVRMKDPQKVRTGIVLRLKSGTVTGHFVDTGSPHMVIFLNDIEGMGLKALEDVPMDLLGPEVRHHPEFQPSGVNVNIVHVMGDKLLRIRTYERGVEAETMACGTGSIASAIAAAETKGMSSPIRIEPLSRKELSVSFEKKGNKYLDVYLEGPAATVFTGTVDL